MSQRALGQAIGFDPPTMSKALSGKRGFRPLELALISETLGIPVQQLLADDGTTAREAVLARVQPEGSPATEQALARVRQMLELDGLLSEQGFEALPAVRPPRLSTGPPYHKARSLHSGFVLSLASGTRPADRPRPARRRRRGQVQC